MTALVVEDDDANYFLVNELLKQLNWNSKRAPNFTTACESIRSGLLAQDAPDLILMDVSLPDGNGFELTRAFRREGVNVPIVVMSTLSNPKMTEEALMAGANAFFAKPFEVNEFQRLISWATTFFWRTSG